MPPLSREIVFHDGTKGVPLTFGACIVIGSGATWIGLAVDGWPAICMFVLAGLLLAFVLYVTQSLLRVGPSKLLLTPQGLVSKVGGKLDVLPPEAIQAVGLIRHKGAPAELMLWYDSSRLPEVPKNISRRESAPGQIRLAYVMDERQFFPPHRVKEVRELVQAHGLGEWRNRAASP